MATIGSNVQSSGALSEKSNGKHPIPHATCLCRIPFRSSSPVVPAPLEFRNLPVWPATRFSWPPPGSLRHRGVFGSPRVSAGELCGTDLQGSRSKGVRQHPCPRLGPFPRADNPRLEVVADGLPLFHSAQLAVDTTMVSTVRADGAPRRQCAELDGAALDQARRTKERTYPELTGENGRPDSWCLRARQEEDGPRSPTHSSDSWPE